jgi:hypothetical protein
VKCGQRQRLATLLAGKANPDGTSIKVGVLWIMRKMGMARRIVFDYLADLEHLGMLVKGRLSKYRGTRVRSINPEFLKLATYIAVKWTDNQQFLDCVDSLEIKHKKEWAARLKSLAGILEVTFAKEK